MDHTYDSSTVEMDRTGFDDLKTQMINSKSDKTDDNQDIRQRKTETPNTKRSLSFRKGDQTVEVDDDYEVEFTADKKSHKLTLRELKDRAAGDIAIKNRMHSLAEEKKRVQATFKEFSSLAKTDPLAALEYISNQAKEADNDFEFDQYLEKLAEQAEKLGSMDEKERKAHQLEKELNKAKSDLSQRERIENIVEIKHDMLAQYPEIQEDQFRDMCESILQNETLMEGLEDEFDVMDRVEELIQETLTQRDIITVIKQVNPAHIHDNELIFSLSDQIRQNPDLDEEDIRDIIREVIGGEKTLQREAPHNKQAVDRQKDIRTLSQKARQSAPDISLRTQNADPYDLLKEQLLERKKEFSRTPLYAR